MQLFYKNREAQKKKDLIETINSLMEISIQGLCILFATEDNNHKPYGKVDDYDSMYSKQGFYANLEIEDGLIPNPCPNEVDGCTLGKSWSHFIWISKGICDAEEIHFAWVYSHELQHLKQSLNNPYLLILADLLENAGYEVSEFATEFDCERKAKEIMIRIFSEDKCNSYLRKMLTTNVADDKKYIKLLELNVTEDFNVEHEMQQDICAKKEQLKSIQKQMENSNNTRWNIDIDKLCSCRNPHEAIISAVARIA